MRKSYNDSIGTTAKGRFSIFVGHYGVSFAAYLVLALVAWRLADRRRAG